MGGRHADGEESKVEEMLAICSEESLLKLSLNTHSISASSDSLVLDSDLLARLHRLKAPPPVIPPQPQQPSHPSPLPPDPLDLDILGAHLASRLAALKQPSIGPSPHADAPPEHSQPPAIAHGLPSANPTSASHAPDVCSRREEELDARANSVSSSRVSEVEKLLASVSDQIRLEKANAPQKARVSDDDDAADETKDSEEQLSDTDVDNMVEWAKDAARLDVCDDEEDDDAGLVFDEAVQDESTPSISSRPRASKKTRKGWKFW